MPIFRQGNRDGDGDDAATLLRAKDREIAECRELIRKQTQQINDLDTVISTQRGMIATLMEKLSYYEERLNEFDRRINEQEQRTEEMEQRMEELAIQVEWIQRNILGLSATRRPEDYIC